MPIFDFNTPATVGADVYKRQVLPEQLQSPLLTAEWEYRLGEIERGELAPEDFMAEITAMLKELVGTYQVIKGSEPDMADV